MSLRSPHFGSPHWLESLSFCCATIIVQITEHTLGASTVETCAFYANFGTFSFDFVIRQKVGGTHLSQNYLQQLPVIPRHTYTAALLDFIMPRVLELTYTAWDM